MTTNRYHTVIYTGVTADLRKRIEQHKNQEFKSSFTSNYNCDRLVWYENFLRVEEAILREKQIKGGSRKAKEELIDSFNPSGKTCGK